MNQSPMKTPVAHGGRMRRRGLPLLTGALAALLLVLANASLAVAAYPTAATRSASMNSKTVTWLEAEVNPGGEATEVVFEYGLLPNSYGTTTTPVYAGSGTKTVTVSAAVGGLTTGTTYHFRAHATNATGPGYGKDQVVTPGWFLKGGILPSEAESKYGRGEAIACTPPALTLSCVGVGSYQDKSGNQLPLTGRFDGSKWTPESIPAVAGGSKISLLGVSCPSSTSCTSVGAYEPTGTGVTKPLSFGWNGTSWSQKSIGWAYVSGGLEAIACNPTTQNCVATGSLETKTETKPFTQVAFAGGLWSEKGFSNPAGGAKGHLPGVTCPGVAYCLAVGYYEAGGVWKPMAGVWNGFEWKLTAAPVVPFGAKQTYFSAVSCSSETACTAVGRYQNEAGAWLPLAERWNGANWAQQTVPTAFAATATELTGVSCATASACTATGTQTLPSGVKIATAAQWNGMAWTAQGPSNVPNNPQSTMPGISCRSATYCVSMGTAESATTSIATAELYER